MRIRLALMALAALSFSAPAQAQDPQTVPQSDNSGAPVQPSTKKVWTNDNLVPNPDTALAPASSTKTRPAKPGPRSPEGKNVGWYRGQISKLNSQIAGIDKKVATYQAALKGEAQPSAGVQPYQMRAADWHSEIQRLTREKQDLQGKIGALEDEARRNGIEPGQLR